MSIICRLLGHKPPLYHGHPAYGRLKHYAIDNLHTEHAQVIARCDRCEEDFEVCKVHLIPRYAEEKLQKRLDQITKAIAP
jgi:hypothetical protein